MSNSKRSVDGKSSSVGTEISGDSRKFIHDKDLFASTQSDSGYIASGDLTSSEILSQEIKPNLDSGVLDDIDEGNDIGKSSEKSKKESTSYMRFDSGVDVDLTESLSGLNLTSDTENLNDLNKKSNTSSSKCALRTNEEIISPTQTLMEKSSASNAEWELYFRQDDDGDTPLHLAIIHGFIEGIYSLIRLAPHPCLLDIKNDFYQTPLHLAVATRQTRVVRLLVVAGAQRAARNAHGDTPLHLACHAEDFSCVQALTAPVSVAEFNALGLSYSNVLHEPIDFDQWNYDGQTCLHIAALNGHVEILRHLVWNGADINAKEGKSCCTALHYACEKGDQNLLQFLLTECPKIKLELMAYGKCTPYQLASLPSIRKTLAKHGAATVFDESNSEFSDDDSEDEISSYEQQSCFSQSAGVPINASA